MFTLISKGAELNLSGLHNFHPSLISFCSQFKAETERKNIIYMTNFSEHKQLCSYSCSQELAYEVQSWFPSGVMLENTHSILQQFLLFIQMSALLEAQAPKLSTLVPWQVYHSAYKDYDVSRSVFLMGSWPKVSVNPTTTSLSLILKKKCVSLSCCC